MVGASYVSLECGGFLHALGLNVTIMVRSILLRGFDQQIAEKIGDFMELEGVKFIRPCVPTKVLSVSCCTKFHKIYLKSKETKVNSHDICKQVVRGFCTNYLNGF